MADDWSPWPTVWWTVAVGIVALAVIGFGLWWWNQPGTDDIAATVKADMQSFLVQDSEPSNTPA